MILLRNWSLKISAPDGGRWWRWWRLGQEGRGLRHLLLRPHLPLLVLPHHAWQWHSLRCQDHRQQHPRLLPLVESAEFLRLYGQQGGRGWEERTRRSEERRQVLVPVWGGLFGDLLTCKLHCLAVSVNILHLNMVMVCLAEFVELVNVELHYFHWMSSKIFHCFDNSNSLFLWKSGERRIERERGRNITKHHTKVNNESVFSFLSSTE